MADSTKSNDTEILRTLKVHDVSGDRIATSTPEFVSPRLNNLGSRTDPPPAMFKFVLFIRRQYLSAAPMPRLWRDPKRRIVVAHRSDATVTPL
jgi:hypothetical protein